MDVKDVLHLKQKMLSIITKYSIKSMLPEDILQEYYLRIFRQSDKDGKSYVERYDGSSTFATWLYKPLQNLCKTIKTRENSDAGKALLEAKVLEEAPEKEDDFNPDTLYLEHFVSSSINLEDELLATQLLEVAKQNFSSYHSTSPKGMPRSIYAIVLMTAKGFTKAEIARILDVSATFVDSQLKKFLQDKEVLIIKQEYLDDI